jgi:hypothetical protein
LALASGEFKFNITMGRNREASNIIITSIHGTPFCGFCIVVTYVRKQDKGDDEVEDSVLRKV